MSSFSQSISSLSLLVGDVQISPVVRDGLLLSLGTPCLDGMALRGNSRWLPWFDAYEGEVFNRFRFEGLETRGDTQVIRTTAICDNDYPFRERRDSSGDLCFRNLAVDAPPVESQFDICFQSVSEVIDGRMFSGFKYWFEYTGGTAIHRIIDRQTWELGGNVEDVDLLCRNWLTPPHVRLSEDTAYSTVGLEQWAKLLPGNLWARWSLLPAFDLQYSLSGVLLGHFDEVSLIRNVIESNTGEAALRVLDMHAFTQSQFTRTNPKTILYCPDILDDVDALNLWTRVHDAESAKARAQFGLPETEAAPTIVFAQNVWKNIRFDSTYEHALEVAAEFGGDYLFIDPVWEHQQAWRESLEELLPTEKEKGTIFEKFNAQNMCVTLDFEVAQIHGGEAELKKLCERAASKNLKLLSWMATHLSPNSIFMTEANQASKESGRHPDTGYTMSCWPIRGGSPAWYRMKEQLLEVCERTGLQGFLWDSFSNIGWWQLDYRSGTMAPQLPHIMELYRDLENAGLYILPEAILSFSNHSCAGLHGGNVYEGDSLGFSYNTNIALEWDETNHADAMLRGQQPTDLLFRCLAHKRVPSFNFHNVPREAWDETSAAEIKRQFGLYRKLRDTMQIRTVLKADAGVLWQSANDEQYLWNFRNQNASELAADSYIDASNSEVAIELRANHVYRVITTESYYF